MAYPTGTPVKERVMTNLVAALEAIDGSPAYHHEVLAVKRQSPDNPVLVFTAQEFPAIILSHADISRDDSVNAMIQCELGVTVRASLLDRENHATELEWLVADLHKALLTDVTRGGVAMDTKILGETVYEQEEVTGVASVDLAVRVRFRHLYDDPNTPI